MYGATEVGGVANLIVGPDYRPGIVGVPSPTCDVEIVGSDDQPLPAGEVGQIRLRSKSMCHGYLGDSREHNEKAFRDGWFYPGDFGRLLPDGRLQIEGRDTDHLNIGGVKVNALLIDEIMASAEGVQDAACFLLPGQFGVGQLAAMLVHEDGYDAETVKKNIAAAFEADPRSRPAMFPRQVFSTNKVPRNENGKVMRHVATRLAQQAM